MSVRPRVLGAALGALLAPLGAIGVAAAAALEDAESGAAAWSVYDADPAGATVETVFDDALGSTVFETRGDGRANGYRLGGRSAADGWNETAAFHLGFRLRTEEPFALYALVDTRLGRRYLHYTHSNRDALLSANGRYVHHGLGSRARDGRWYDWRRDLAADLADAEPDNALVAVHGLLVRGNVRLDDVRLDAEPGRSTVLPRPAGPVRLDAEGGDASAWRLRDATPEGATVAVVDDAERGSAVYEFRGDGTRNGWLAGGLDAVDGWRGDAAASRLSWAMRTDRGWALHARVETTGGPRYLTYTASDTSSGPSSNGLHVRLGLGRGTRNGRWQDHERDLAADLAEHEPGVELVAVHGVFVRGELRLDDLALSGANGGPGTGPEVPTVYADGDASGWRVWDETPAGASIASVEDAGETVVELVGTGLENAFLLGGADGAAGGWNNRAQHGLLWRLRADAPFVAYARVETDAGFRWLAYQPRAGDAGPNGDGTVLYFGLGANAADGAWRAHARDLRADLARFEPGSELLAVHGFALRGSARIDDLALRVPPADEPVAPVAAFVAAPVADDPLGVAFDAGASSADPSRELVAWTWDFGDGTAPATLDGPLARHAYALPGDYEVALAVTDSAGATASASASVAVAGAADGGVSDAGATGGSGGGSDDGETDSGGGATGADTGGTTSDGGTDGGATGGTAGGTTGGTTGDDSGGGSGGGSGSDSGGGAPDAREIDAARLLAQATFGPTEEAIAEVAAIGPEAWIDRQLALPMRSQLEQVKAITANASRREPRHDVWWREAIEAEDQLRQRVAFALSEIFVVADTGYTLGNAQHGMAAYYDRLLAGAFGRYRDLLEDVTLSPVMGVWLSMLQNAKGDEDGNTRADENFAREVLQLFSIGLVELNPDGTVRLVDGAPVPTFDTETVEHYARAFTGWNFDGAVRWDVPLIASGNDYESDMVAHDGGAWHDTGPKALLGGVVTPAGATAEEDLAAALDSIAAHPNVAPFVTEQLIQRLVTSNPTPAYVARAAGAFADTGGDLGATVKAILLDPEAREGHGSVPDFGKLREPLLRVSHLWRAFDVVPGSRSVGGFYNTRSPHPKDLDGALGQAVLKSPSVFNFFAPDHAPAGAVRDAGKLAPEAAIYTEALVLSTTTRINEHVQYHHDAGGENERKWSFVRLADERALADDPEALLDRLDLLLLSGSMSEGLRAILVEHLEGIPVSATDPEAGRSARARDAITLIVASPEYLVQR